MIVNMKIQLHKNSIYEEVIQDLYRFIDKRIPNKLGQSLERTSNDLLGQLYNINLEFIVYSLLNDHKENKDKVRASTQLLIQSDTLQYLSLFDKSEPSKTYLGDNEVEVQKSDALQWTGQFIQIRLFYWSFIGQSSKTKEVLLTNNYLPLWTAEGWLPDYLRAHYGFLKLVIQDKLEDARDFYADVLYPAYEELAPVDRVEPKFYLPLWDALLKDNEQLFNEELLNCLEGFKEYWGFATDSEPYKNNDINGHFALEITALIKVAKLRGYDIKVTSDYTPEFFTSKDFEVDIDTKLDWYFTPKKIDFGSPIDLEALLRENRS